MKRIFSFIIILLIAFTLCGCELLDSVWQAFKQVASEYVSDEQIQGRVKAPKTAIDSDSLTESHDGTWLGLKINHGDLKKEIPFYEKADGEKGTVEYKWGVGIDKVIPSDHLYRKGVKIVQNIVKEQFNLLPGYKAADVDYRKLFSYSFDNSFIQTDKDNPMAFTWADLTQQVTYDNKTLTNCNIILDKKNYILTYVDCVPTDKSDITTASRDSKFIKSFANGEAMISLYRTITINDEPVYIRKFVASSFTWTDQKGNEIVSKGFPATWLSDEISSYDDLKWTDINGKTGLIAAKECYYLTQYDADQNAFFIGAILEKDKNGEGALVCLAPVSLDID